MLVNSYFPVALSLLHYLGETRNILRLQNIEKVLIELLAVENDSIRTAACQAVSTQGSDPSSKETFRQLGIVPNINLLKF